MYFCSIGGLRTLFEVLRDKKFGPLRLELFDFIHELISSSEIILQIFIGIDGLQLIMEILSLEITDGACIKAVFLLRFVLDSLPSMARRDFCHSLVNKDVIAFLVFHFSSKSKKISSNADLCTLKTNILEILNIFAVSDSFVREQISKKSCLKTFIAEIPMLECSFLLLALRFVKNLSISSTCLTNLEKYGLLDKLLSLLSENVANVLFLNLLLGCIVPSNISRLSICKVQ